MEHSDFHIGMEFFTGAGKWRCTDIGTRVIIAISLESRETVRGHYDEYGVWREERFMRTIRAICSDRPTAWLNTFLTSTTLTVATSQRTRRRGDVA